MQAGIVREDNAANPVALVEMAIDAAAAEVFGNFPDEIRRQSCMQVNE